MVMICASVVAVADAVSAVADTCTAAAVCADAAVEIHIFVVVGVDFGVGSRHEVAAVPLRMQQNPLSPYLILSVYIAACIEFTCGGLDLCQEQIKM